MSARELRLLIVLGLIVGGGGGAMAVYQWFYKPLNEANATIKKLNKDIAEKNRQLDNTLAERKLLDRARQMSLSPNPDIAIAEYNKFIRPLLAYSELEIETLRPNPVTDYKSAASGTPGPAGSSLKPGHQVVTFQARAKGDIEGLVKVLEGIQKTPLVHRIKTLTVDRADTTPKATGHQLVIGLTVESLIVSRAEPRADGPLAPDQRLIALETLLALRRGPTGLAMLPWFVGPTGPLAQQRLANEGGYRQYGDMAYKNLFAGAVDPPPPPEVPVESDAGIDVTEFVRLDTLDPDGKVAFFRNLIFKMPPIRVKSVKNSGFDVFRIQNENKTKTALKAKVLRIDQRDMYIQVNDEVYGIHIGQSLSEAMRRPLSEDEMTERKLTSLYDAQYAAQEARLAAQASSAAPGGNANTKKKGKR
jgi:hypothetical protein